MEIWRMYFCKHCGTTFNFDYDTPEWREAINTRLNRHPDTWKVIS